MISFQIAAGALGLIFPDGPVFLRELHPAAALAMALSSLMVVGHSLRLQYAKLDEKL